MKKSELILREWQHLKESLMLVKEVAKRRTDFDLEDDLTSVINKMNYHTKYSIPRFELELTIATREERN